MPLSQPRVHPHSIAPGAQSAKVRSDPVKPESAAAAVPWCSYERLVRKLLALPRQPAVVLLHAFRGFDPFAK